MNIITKSIVTMLGAAAACSADVPGNIAQNGDFESGISPWIARWAPGVKVIADPNAYSGQGAAWITNRTSASHGISQSLLGRMQSGVSYACTAWVRAESLTSQTVTLAFEKRDDTGITYTTVKSATTASNSWTCLSGLYNFNYTGTLTNIYAYVSGAASGVDLRVDCVSIVPITSSSLTANYGFETGTAPWYPTGPASLASDSNTAQSGSNSAWVTSRTTSSDGVAQSLLGKMRPGAGYTCSAWMRAESDTPQVLTLTMVQTDALGTRYLDVATTIASNRAWTFLTGGFTLNASGTLSDVAILARGPEAGVDLRADSMVVVPLSGFRLAAASAFPNVYLGCIGNSEIHDNYFGPGRVAGADYHIAGSGNYFKFAYVHPSSNAYSYTLSDACLAHAEANGQLARGHALIWHNQFAPWVTNAPCTTNTMRAIFYDHITTVASHYRDRLAYWDVVNEGFNGAGMQNSIWYNQPGIGFTGQGTRYIEEAFKCARTAAPNCKLIYNDYDAEGDNAKSDAIYAMAQHFKSNGIPLDGIGFQFHIYSGSNLAGLTNNFQRFSDLGLDLHITEFDYRIPVDANGVASTADLDAQGNKYFTIFGTALAFPRMRIIQTWGFSDKYSWVPGYYGTNWGAALPVDEYFNRKPAWWAIWNVLANQAEKLAVSATSAGDVPTTSPFSYSLSAGAALLFPANATNDFITLTVPVPYPGEYNIKIGVRQDTTSGRFQLAATTEPGGSLVNLGGVKEMYYSWPNYTSHDMGAFTFTKAGAQSFRFTIPSKNSASSGYNLYLDYIRLTPTGADGNQPPTVMPLDNQAVNQNGICGPVAFSVSDRETVESALVMSVFSSNTNLLPAGNILITGNAGERLVTALPIAGQYGAAVVTVVATDADGASASNQFIIGVAPVTESLVSTNSAWKYWNSVTNPGSDWSSTGYDDAAWRSGTAPLGFGGSQTTTLTNYGQVTTYYRRWCSTDLISDLTNLTLSLPRGDGAVVWLNGTEAFRYNLPAGTITSTTPAVASITGSVATTLFTTNLLPALLVTGPNLIAVEIHQDSSTTNALSFNLGLEAVHSEAHPSITAFASTGGQLRVTWPSWATTYELQVTTNLLPPATWSPVPLPPAYETNQWAAQIPLPAASQAFYRILKL